MTVIHTDLESNPHNDNGTAVAFYFEGQPTAADVRDACVARGKGSLGLLYGEEPEFEVVPTPVSERAGLVRVLVYNVG